MSTPETLGLLRRGEPPPAAATRTRPRAAEGDEAARHLACGYCRRVVTSAGTRIERSGAHAHSFVNPHGIRFEIGCFGQAPGCRSIGSPSTEWTWFAGYSWRVECCRSCGEQLGWFFHAGDDAFHALILARLEEVDGA